VNHPSADFHFVEKNKEVGDYRILFGGGKGEIPDLLEGKFTCLNQDLTINQAV
jgi:hypothetical protein